MVKYTIDELTSISDLNKNSSKIIMNLKNKVIDKIGIVSNDTIETVLISVEEYERLKGVDEFLNSNVVTGSWNTLIEVLNTFL